MEWGLKKLCNGKERVYSKQNLNYIPKTNLQEKETVSRGKHLPRDIPNSKQESSKWCCERGKPNQQAGQDNLIWMLSWMPELPPSPPSTWLWAERKGNGVCKCNLYHRLYSSRQESSGPSLEKILQDTSINSLFTLSCSRFSYSMG